jgi:release factor glutamine methyltransferase
MTNDYRPMMPDERIELIRAWHEHGYAMQRASLPKRMSFMGLDLRIGEAVFAPDTEDGTGDPYHRAVEAEVQPSDRVLDMGTGSGVSGILAARKGARVVAVDVNPTAVACARGNAKRNGVADRMTFAVADVFDGVEGDFDLIVFDPPFRWFKPRDLLEAGSTDENYRALTRFMAAVKGRLRPNGRVLLNFGTSADMDYLQSLIRNEGMQQEMRQYGEVTKDGFTARYYVIRLTA